jgi:hypothetical protein
MALANPPPGAAKPAMRLATGDNVAAPAAAVSPKVMSQVNRIADNSAKAEKQVAASIDENERKKNLEGATFADSGGAPPGMPGAPGGAPVLVDAGGRRPASWQVSEGMDLGPEAREAVGDANVKGRDAARLDYEAGQQAANFERGYLEQHAQAADRFAAQEATRTQKYEQQVGEHMQALDNLRAQIREAKVDPYDGMNPAAARIGGAIAIALGAFASKHGENAGLEAVKHGIALNVERQTQQLNKLERGSRGEVNFLAQLKQQFGDTNAAQQALYISYLEKAKTELAKKLGDPTVADPRLLAAYDRLQGQLDDDLVKRTAAFKGITEDRVVRHDVNAQPKYVGGPSQAGKADARYLAENYEKAGIPQTLSELKDIDRVIDSFGDGDIPGVGPIVGKVPSVLLGDRAVAGRQAVQRVKNAVGHALFGGALSPTEAEKLDAQLEGAKDAASLRRTVQSVRQVLQHRAANIAAGASPEGVDYYEQHGGSVQRGSPSARQVSPSKPAAPYVREPE